MKTFFALPILPLAIALHGHAEVGDIENQFAASYQITARGQDFATYTKTTNIDSDGP